MIMEIPKLLTQIVFTKNIGVQPHSEQLRPRFVDLGAPKPQEKANEFERNLYFWTHHG